LFWLLSYSSSYSWGQAIRYGSPIYGEFSIASKGVLNGNNLNALFFDSDQAKNPKVGVITAGGFAYAYSGTVYDLMGLNNVEMGHSIGDRHGFKNHAAFNKDIFFDFPLDVLLLDPTSKFDDTATKGIVREDKFVGAWKHGTLSKRDDPEISVTGMFRSNFLEEVLSKQNLEFTEISKFQQASGAWK
jgi:hypothetical protein